MQQQFLYRIRPTRPDMLAGGPTEQEQRIVQAHFAYLQSLTAAGVVLVAGRTTTEDAQAFGIVVFQAESQAAAERLMHGDPAVRDGVMSAELFPFRVALWSTRGPDTNA